MQPHTVAIFNIMNYLKQRDLLEKFRKGTFDVTVYKKTNQYYTIEVEGSKGAYKAHVNGRWTCTSDVEISGSEVKVSHHKHSLTNTNIREKTYLSSSSTSGQIEDSITKEHNGRIDGSAGDSGKNLQFHSTPMGASFTSKVTDARNLVLA